MLQFLAVGGSCSRALTVGVAVMVAVIDCQLAPVSPRAYACRAADDPVRRRSARQEGLGRDVAPCPLVGAVLQIITPGSGASRITCINAITRTPDHVLVPRIPPHPAVCLACSARFAPGCQVPGHHGGVSDLIVISGPPGAGKTTVARALSRLFDRSALVPGDQFFAFIDEGYIAPWTSPAHRQNEIVTEAAGAAAGRLAIGGYTVVYDGVIGPWFLDTFTTAAQLSFLHYAIMLPPEPICLERVRSRSDHGFKDQQAARHMYRQFATADVDPRYVVSSTDAAAVLARQLFDLVHQGRLRWPAHDAPIRACQPFDP
jgi:cytidylate kinase